MYLFKNSLPPLCGITYASSLAGGFASTATQRSLFKYRSGLCASRLNSLMLGLLCTTLAYRVFKVQVKVHFDVSVCQVVTGCFLPASKSEGVVLSTNTSTGLSFLSGKHFNINAHCSAWLKAAANPTCELQGIVTLPEFCASCYPASFVPRLIYLLQCCTYPRLQKVGIPALGLKATDPP